MLPVDKNITDYYDANYTFTLSASLSEGSGTIVFESNDTSLLTISGTTATMLAAGQVTITAEANETTSYNAASQSRSFNLLNKDQTITFAAIADTNTSVSQINDSTSASSALPVSYESNDTSIISVSGSKLNINGGGYVTVTAKQLGYQAENIATGANFNHRGWNPATPVPRSFFVKLVGRPMSLIFDQIGTMGRNASFKPRVTLKDGISGKVINLNDYNFTVAYSITNSVTGTTNASYDGNVDTGTGDGNFISAYL